MKDQVKKSPARLFQETAKHLSLHPRTMMEQENNLMDYVKGNQTEKSIMIVVFPLVSLKKGQVNYLNSKGIKAAYLGEGQ
ncbi:unnamed protein product [Porites lobata]|uniref:Uncharacterized protein n=1 Tax=Porites lobata TaxID=104759 RepID=A0ABN8MT96_9CNID|nr:unnamed protein product [Porites lobata]